MDMHQILCVKCSLKEGNEVLVFNFIFSKNEKNKKKNSKSSFEWLLIGRKIIQKDFPNPIIILYIGKNVARSF